MKKAVICATALIALGMTIFGLLQFGADGAYDDAYVTEQYASDIYAEPLGIKQSEFFAQTARTISIFRVDGDDATVISAAGGAGRAARAGQRLNQGNAIITGNGTYVYLQFDHISIIRIDELSHVMVGFEGGRLALLVQRGSAPVEVQQSAHTAQVVGSNLMIGVRGDFWVEMMSHGVAITEDGALWAWGSNYFGQIGDGTTEYRHYPVRVMDNVIAAQAGDSYTSAVTVDGMLWVWGNIGYAQASLAEQGMSRNSPVPIREVDADFAFREPGAFAYSYRPGHMFIIADGVLLAFGSNWYGQLGDGTTQYQPGWVTIMENVSAVYTTYTHTFAITAEHKLWAWGNNSYGQLGDGTTINRYSPVLVMENVADVFAFDRCMACVTGAYTVVLTNCGSIYAWGSNRLGQLGDGSTTCRHSPVHIIGDIAAVSVGSYRSLALDGNGDLWEWGVNRPSPEKIMGNVSAMSAGSGCVYFSPWRYSPVRNLDHVVYASIGGCSALAITMGGVLWAWGNNWSGQLGDGTTQHRYYPVRIMEDVLLVSTASEAGGGHTLAITNDGALWAWGGILFGGQYTSLAPVRIMEDVVAASAGPGRSMAITSDGILWAWGSNRDGTLGDGTTMDRFWPVPIMENVSAVATGFYHTLAVTFDGDLWAWGYNWGGQLGDGTTESRPYPVQIMGNVANISAGHISSYAITYDGVLWAWPASGESDDGTFQTWFYPVPIMENVRSVYAGIGHGSMAITDDNVLWALNSSAIAILDDASMLCDADMNFPMPVAKNVSAVFLGVSQAIVIPAQ